METHSSTVCGTERHLSASTERLLISLLDAEENLGSVEIEVEFGEDDEEAEEGEAAGGNGEGQAQSETTVRPIRSQHPGADAIDHLLTGIVTRDQILQLFSHGGLGRIFASDYMSRPRHRNPLLESDDEDEEEDNDGTGYGPVRRSLRNRNRASGRAAFQKVPSDEGRRLMSSGTFGSSARPQDTLKRKKRLAYNLMNRELGIGSDGRQKNATNVLKQNMIPESVADSIIHYNARCYSGQFSEDGNFFFSCAQDFRVRMYDTSNPYNWKYYKV
jgi:WD repeat-containing protein 23